MGTTTALTESKPELGDGLALVDCDVHSLPLFSTLAPYLSQRWIQYGETFGIRTRHELDILPGLRPYGSRGDTDPPSGPPGSDPGFAKRQLLDANDVDIAIVNNTNGQTWHNSGSHPLDFTLALQRANNDWAADAWFGSDPRWRAAIACPFEDGDLAAAEIERCVGISDRFVQLLLSTRAQRPLGNQKYWPAYEAAAHFGLPIGIHPGGTGLNQMTGTGWPSYYFENHAGYPQGVFSSLASMIFEGVFDRWPDLKVVVIEGGWTWAVPFAWRLDASWRVLREEVPHLQRKPSEYVGDHVWFTTQPMEEPELPGQFKASLEQLEGLAMGNHLLYSSDYPHWDYDDPGFAFPQELPAEMRRRILATNAVDLYGFDDAATR